MRALPLAMLIVVLLSASVDAQDDVTNEYRLTISPHHPVGGAWSGFARFDLYQNPNGEYRVYRVGYPGVIYGPLSWLQFVGGLLVAYTDQQHDDDLLEVRPYGGVKLFLPHASSWNLYNYIRYEYRATREHGAQDWAKTGRLRFLVGAEIPLISPSKGWSPGTFYGFTDAEAFYRFDSELIDPLRVGVGMGYVLSTHFHLEFTYHAQFTRLVGGGMQITENLLALNVKIGLSEGILEDVLHPSQAP